MKISCNTVRTLVNFFDFLSPINKSKNLNNMALIIPTTLGHYIDINKQVLVDIF